MTEKMTLAKTIESVVKLPESLNAAAIRLDLDFCDVTGFGTVNWVEIEDPAGATVRLDGPLDLLSLRGRLRHAGNVVVGDYRVMLAKHTDNGISVVGGRLSGGEATFLELSFTPLKQATDHSSSISSGTYLGKKTVEKSTKEHTWAKAMELSSALEKKGKSAHVWEEPTVAVPVQGDVVKHRQFGDCLVVKVGDEHIALQKPDGRVVQLGLRILSFTPREKEGAKTLWDVSVKR